MMRKKLIITILSICCGLFFFAACEKQSTVKSISLNGYSAETPLELKIGAFSYGDYTVTVLNDRDEAQVLALTEDMIPKSDQLKFFKEGKSEITITYQGVSTTFEINVSRNVFSETVQLNGLTATYTGKPFTVEVEGDIPGGTEIIYPQGNTFTNAGTYDMTAILQCDGYVTKTISTRIIIEKASYDLSNARLYDAKFVYDKDAHSIAVKGIAVEDENGKILHNPASLPLGVNVSYTITKVRDGQGIGIAADKQQVIEGNKAIDAGVYRVCAQFKGDLGNYNQIPDSVAEMTIERAAYDLSKIEFKDAETVYSGETQSLSIAEDSKMPFDVEVSYKIKQLKDGAGAPVSDELKKGNSAVNAGVYLVKACFSVIGKSAENYTASPLEKDAYLTIRRASYAEAMTGVYLNSDRYEFVEGKTYEIDFDCELPKGVTPQFTILDGNGARVEGEMETLSVTEGEGDEQKVTTIYRYSFKVETVGEYTCVITFSHTDTNYAEITTELKAWFLINLNEAV